MKFYLLFSLGIFIFILPAFSQTEEAFNADSLFMVARQKSIDGQYDKSIELTQKLLKVYPDYTDAELLLARTYAWQGNYDKAYNAINKILEDDAGNYEANSALIDFYFWDGDNDSAISAANKALNIYPNDVNVLIKKAKIQLADEDFNGAESTLDLLNSLEPENESVIALGQSLKGNSYSNIIRLEHYFDAFDQPYRRRWHMSSVGYGRKTPLGVYYGKVYWGDLVESGEKLFSDQVATQYALEFYPKFNKSNYMFLNYSFSNDNLFPKNRFGIEYYHVFKYGIETSIGYRYLDFVVEGKENSQIHIFTGSLAKYQGNFWFSFRPYIVSIGNDMSYKYMLSIRDFLKKEESYIELVLGTGVSPDNPIFYTSGQDIQQLGSWRVQLGWKQKIASFLIFELEGSYEDAEYMKNFRRDQYTLRSSLSFLF